jgi:flagellar motor switch protein FliM
MTATLDISEARYEDGSNKLLETAASVDRWPMLSVLFERFALDCAQALRKITPTPTYFSLTGLNVTSLEAVLEGWNEQVLTAIFSVPEWDQQVFVGLDKGFIFSFLEVLLGSPSVSSDVASRALTPLTMRVAGVMFEQVAQSLKVAFEDIVPINAKHERIETRLDLVGAGKRNQPMLVVDIGFQALGAGGHIFVVIPQAVLLPMKAHLTRKDGKATTVDPGWSQQIDREIQRTLVSVQAVIERENMTLGEIARLNVGTILLLPSTTNLRVKLLSNEQSLFWCELGQIDGGYTVKIEETIDEQTEFINTLLV